MTAAGDSIGHTSDGSIRNTVSLPILTSSEPSDRRERRALGESHRRASVLRRQRNASLNSAEQQVSKEYIASKPITIVLPTGSKCNLRCVFCTDRSSGSPYRYKNLSFDEFLEFAAPLNEAKSVGLYGWGEPLVNRDYARIFSHVINDFHGIELHVTTNGVLLDDRWARRFLDYEWTRLTISIYAATPTIYERVMQSNAFSQVVSNVHRLLSLRRAWHKNSPRVTLSFVTMVHNIHELPLFVDLAADLGADSVLVQDFKILEDGQEKYSLFNASDLASRHYELALARSHARGIPVSTFQPSSYFDRHKVADCFEPWESFRIGENGNVYPCCYSNQVMGNILTHNVDEVWNGEVYRRYRRTVNSDDPPAECRLCTKKAQSLDLMNHQWHRV